MTRAYRVSKRLLIAAKRSLARSIVVAGAVFPHLYIDYRDTGPFSGAWELLQVANLDWFTLEGLKRIKIFPEDFPKQKFGKIYKERTVILAPYQLSEFKRDGKSTLIDLDGSYDLFKITDVFHVEDRDEKDYRTYAEVTHRFKITMSDLAEKHPSLHWQFEQHDSKLPPDRVVDVLELVRVYEHQFADE